MAAEDSGPFTRRLGPLVLQAVAARAGREVRRDLKTSAPLAPSPQ
jgi:hypothetical protein